MDETNAATKLQYFPFYFNGPPFDTAARVVHTCGDDFHCRLVEHLKFSLCHAVAANRVSRQADGIPAQ